MIAVVEDASGNAMGGHSVRGPRIQDAFSKVLTKRHRSVLDGIPDNSRGCGHGFCAEQPLTQNARHIQFNEIQGRLNGDPDIPTMFAGGRNKITAYRCAKGSKEYNVPTPPCDTCLVTNSFFGFIDDLHAPSNIADVPTSIADAPTNIAVADNLRAGTSGGLVGVGGGEQKGRRGGTE